MGLSKILADYKFQSGYAKYIPDLKRNETWDEAVSRVMSLHEQQINTIISEKYKDAPFDLKNQALNKMWSLLDEVGESYRSKLVLGSQRALQWAIEPIFKHNARMYNCTVSYADRISFFNEAFYWLLSGAGVGFSVQRQHINKLPPITQRNKGVKVFVVPDSIEGWSNAAGVLISSFVNKNFETPFPEYQGYRVDFDLSQIRPKGAFITGGFKAPGPDGLRNSLLKISNLLESQVNNQQGENKIKSIVAYDIVMLNAKTGNWYINNPQRARSNNSVLLVRNKTSKEQFDKIFESVKQWGEPGFIWSDDEDILYNPCVEIGMYPKTEDGISGWECCNLTEINGGACNTPEKFYQACRASAILGTIQATYTNFPYLTEASKQIIEREALLGCSLTGWMNNPKILFNPEVLEKGASIIKEVNVEVAKLLKINPAARTTCVKPAGTSSILLETASGIHGEHSKKYIRNVQVNKLEEHGQIFQKYNPNAVEESVWSANKTDNVISFPIEPKENSITKKDLIGIKQLEYVKLVQKHWVEPGTNVELCVKPYIRHNVSNTINVENWDETRDYIYENKDYFAGISLLSVNGDKDYKQAPFVEIFTAQEILEKYGAGSIFASGLIVDGLHAFNDDLWDACDHVLNESIVIPLNSSTVLKKDWIRRAKKFAKNYFKNDLLQMTYCLKDVHLNKRYHDIKRTLKPIDWTKEVISVHFTDVDTLGSAACAGGSCEI
jgi:ribonucleoside-diphosphate reductase alpha chain